MRILVVGGGLSGAALASFLKDRPDIQITLVDKAPKWGNIGYAIVLWGNGRQMMHRLGAAHDIAKLAYEIPWDVIQDKKGGVLKQFFLDPFRVYGPTVSITRTDLHKAITDRIGGNTTLRLGTTVNQVSQDQDGAHVTFSDGGKETFDVVVGADGIHSQIRDLVFGKGFFRYYGWTVWAFWTPQGLSAPKGGVEVTTGGRLYFSYPTGDKAVLLMAAACDPQTPDPVGDRRQRLHHLFADFHESVGHMIDAIEDPARIYHDDMGYVEMDRWHEGRVVLVGDAQHAASPLTGMGASMALEDAYVLAEELKGVQPGVSVLSALDKFQKRRDRRVRKFHRASRFLERWLMVKSPFLAMFRDVILRIVPIRYFTGPIENLLKEDV